MKLSPEQFFKTITKLQLTESERSRTKSFLHAYMATTPVIQSSWYMRRSVLAFSFLALVAVSGGLITFAEQAIPGDTTYQIKIGVTEPLRDAIAISEEGQLLWEVTKAERRMEEMELLATENGF